MGPIGGLRAGLVGQEGCGSVDTLRGQEMRGRAEQHGEPAPHPREQGPRVGWGGVPQVGRGERPALHRGWGCPPEPWVASPVRGLQPRWQPSGFRSRAGRPGARTSGPRACVAPESPAFAQSPDPRAAESAQDRHAAGAGALVAPAGDPIPGPPVGRLSCSPLEQQRHPGDGCSRPLRASEGLVPGGGCNRV